MPRPRKFPLSKAHVDPVMAKNVCDSMSDKEMCVRFSVAFFCISITRLLLRRGRKERNAFSGPKFPFFKFPEGRHSTIIGLDSRRLRGIVPILSPFPFNVCQAKQGDRVAIFRSSTGLKMFMLKVKTTCLVSCSGESLNKFAFLFLQM